MSMLMMRKAGVQGAALPPTDARRGLLDTGRRILNIDIGGGTTKLSILAAGEVTATAALEVGGRLVAADADG